MKIHPMWDEYPALRNELEATISLIEEHIRIKNIEVQNKIKEMLFSGGKLLRPAYTILFSQFSSKQNVEKSRALAAAVEVLHMATLIHDDVIDESNIRRGQATMNAAYNNRIAVYTGDYLFTVCFRLLQDYVNEAGEVPLDTKGMETILIGELNQMSKKYAVKMRMRDYLSQVKGKTAQLFALSCYSGAYSRDEKFAKQAYQIGNNIGMAFQITDDILDYSYDAKKIGKPPMQDLRNGIYTAPLLYAMETKKKEIEPYLLKKESITDEELLQVLKIVEESGGIEKARELAAKYTNKALKQIKNLPDVDAKISISRITEQMLQRNF
ncbi:polyprenyl synthetase family protein [Jeotgalibaca ciconiae]|uniref:Polyprenyl synthetase family protein n=1 Tax=Jeotgalibaca ciconiae TaxID=2496265 RepID=A0A3S9H9Y1_9LACT|nr:polyprenyl synthetase family protein [Jeotgalibaca ciconiae]AZP04190.1 polyprenyl synthetase family protein [Jeotgalibaca ciconiae]HJB23035.1 polyprenyl synthetase family protein [Candidatus Jeotgalibaca pullicola]